MPYLEHSEENIRLVKECILKWKAKKELFNGISSSIHSILSSQHCPLCQVYNVRNKKTERYPYKVLTFKHETQCNGCPIYAYTLRVGCSGTPYETVALSNARLSRLELTGKGVQKDSIAVNSVGYAIDDEIAFLESILAKLEAKEPAAKRLFDTDQFIT